MYAISIKTYKCQRIRYHFTTLLELFSLVQIDSRYPVIGSTLGTLAKHLT